MSSVSMDPKELAAALEAMQGLAATAANPHLLDSLREQAAAKVVAMLADLRMRVLEGTAEAAPTGAPKTSGILKPKVSGYKS